MDELSTLKTDDQALQILRSAAARKPTAAEMFEQRVSFVFGSVKPREGMTREVVRKLILEQHEGLQQDAK